MRPPDNERRGLLATGRQVVYTGPGELELAHTDVPEPGPGDLIMRVRRVGVCATDLHLLDGHIGAPFPLVPGHEFVGEVAAVGPLTEDSAHHAVGDRICVEMLLPCRQCARCREGRYNLCDRDDVAAGLPRGREYGINIPSTVAPGLWGGYADYLTVPQGAIVHRLPSTLAWDTAALVEPLAVAFRAVHRGRVRPGDRVAVVGPGPVGLLTAAASSLAGAAQIAVIGTRPSRLAVAERFGADATIDSGVVTDLAAELRDVLGQDPDVVIETAGVAAAQTQAVRLVRRGGRVVLAGACGSGVGITFRSDEDLLTREIDLLPSFLSAGGYEPAVAALRRPSFPWGELITHRFALERVVDALDLVRNKADGVLKAVLVPTE